MDMWLFILAQSLIAIIWSIPFTVLSLFEVRIYREEGIPKMRKIYPHVVYSSIWNGNEPYDWIVGRWFIGYVKRQFDGRNSVIEVHVLMSKYRYESIFTPEAHSDVKSITFWERIGDFYGLRYDSRSLSLPKLRPLPIQQTAIDMIINLYESRASRIVVGLIYGPTRSGKSYVANFVASELLNRGKRTVHLVDTYNLTTPNDNFALMYNKINPTETSPMILVFEEVDIIINEIHNGLIANHKIFPIQAQNKTGWNQFMDRFDRETYQHVILLMTTNKSKEYFDQLDQSYMREGRINCIIHLE